jgi:hypothetical protein
VSARNSASLGARVTVYLVTAALGHLLWETLQLPLYTIWSTGSLREILVAAVHCTGGDILITASTLGIAIAFARLCGWTLFGGRMVVSVIALGIAYTILSEWLNVNVWRSWAYASAMPVLLGTGTGLAPLLQWLIVPSLAFAITLSWSPTPPNSQPPPDQKRP